MKHPIIKILNFILFLGIGMALLYFSFKGIDFNQVIQDIKKANFFLIGLSLVFMLIAHFSRAYRWNLLIESLGHKPRFSSTFYAVMIGYTANFALPRIGEITRCGVLGKRDKIPFDSLIGTVVAERAFDLITLIILLCLTILLKIELFGSFFQEYLFAPLYTKINSIFDIPLWLIIGIIIFTIAGLLVLYLLRVKILELKAARKLKDIIKGILVGFKSVLLLKRRGAFLLHTIIIWGCYLISTYITLLALEYTAGLNMEDALFILILTSLGMTAPVQGGFGAYHGIVSLGLTLYGISRLDGLVYATIAHESMTIFTILVGLLCYLLIFLQKKQYGQAGNN
jgi:glycosyltransferase 2 family protein